ncbi:peptidase [Rhizocola hellebori]|uniref:Aminopeptidase N n=1 Tax=Rhizocola hellebori TaxID=1392758 RepID=A0A8J3QFH9_9ACTN|nr:M1 family metallopeptidase [Rhizocola hellebori]GIH09930.1 peptidase [Rhizocola hellebori]
MRRIALLMAAFLALGACSPLTPPAPLPGPATASPPKGLDYAPWQAGQSVPVADPLYPQHGSVGIDVLHYGLDLTWEPAEKQLTGAATVRMRANTFLPKITLDFSHTFTVESVTVDGLTTASSIADDNLTIPVALAKDRYATLVIVYHGTPATVPMPSHRSDAEGLGLTVTPDGSLWTMQEPYGAFTWYPVNDHPSDKALYDIAITVPEGWAGIASGTPAGQAGNTFKYTATDPMASYLATLAVGKYKKETAIGPHGIPLTYWYRPGIDDAMMPAIRKTPQYLEWLEFRFGPYPFPSAGVVIVPSKSAMETQQLLTMGNFKMERASDLEDVLVHEYAHQWFGDAVGPSNWNELWLNEGWAMYIESLWSNNRDKVSDKSWETWARQRDAELRAQFGPPGHPRADSFAESNVYICPALLLHQIRKNIGEESFYALGKAWVSERRFSTQDRTSFIAFVNRHTGRDFTQLIHTWLDSPRTPPP